MPPLFAGGRAPPSAGPSLLSAVVVGCLLGAALSGLSQLRLARDASAIAQPGAAAQAASTRAAAAGGGAAQAGGAPPPVKPPPPPPPPSPPPPAAASPPAAAPWPAGRPALAPPSYPRTSADVAALSAPPVPGLPAQCHARANSDLGGELAGGAPHGDSYKLPDAGACCAACAAHTGTPRCNVWVWHNGTRACWMKHARHFPERPYVYHQDGSPWTGGSLYDAGGDYVAPAAAAGGAAAAPPTCIHSVLTSNGNSYMNWQTRVMYATWQAAGREEGAGGLMTTFTRVLHRMTDDELMIEIPTKRFNPARPACDTYCDFPVADRSIALAQWSVTPDANLCSHIMMIEADYLFVRAVPRYALPPAGHAMGFHFGYISPDSMGAAPITKRYVPGADPADVPQTGNAPQLMTGADFRALMPAWAAMHARLEADPEAVKEFNWVRDMYSYSYATMERAVVHHVPLVPFNPLMVQPPADVTLGEACILHYTWGPIIHVIENGTKTVLWQFDKRSYAGGQSTRGPVQLQRLAKPPPFREGMRLQANETVTPSGLALMALLVDVFNAAVDGLPDLPRGWANRTEAEAAARPRNPNDP